MRKLCIFTDTGGKFTGYYRFLKGFYGLADFPTIFQERIDKTLEYKHSAWLEDIITVTKGDLKKHETEVQELIKKLENAGNRLNPKKREFFKNEIEWVGHKIDQHGIRPLQDKLEAITKINTPEIEKRTKTFSWGNTLPFKIQEKLISEHRCSEKNPEEEQRMELDRRTYERIQQTKRVHHEYSMSSTLQCK